MNAATAEQNAAYRAGLCIDCRAATPAAGRPRCDTCDHQRLTTTPQLERT